MKFFVLGIIFAAGCADDGGPRLDAVTPSATHPGGMVTLTGSRLCGPHADCAAAGGEVLVGLGLPQIQAQILAYSDTVAMIGIPDITPLGQTSLVVTVDDQSSNALPFEVQ